MNTIYCSIKKKTTNNYHWCAIAKWSNVAHHHYREGRFNIFIFSKLNFRLRSISEKSFLIIFEHLVVIINLFREFDIGCSYYIYSCYTHQCCYFSMSCFIVFHKIRIAIYLLKNDKYKGKNHAWKAFHSFDLVFCFTFYGQTTFHFDAANAAPWRKCFDSTEFNSI